MQKLTCGDSRYVAVRLQQVVARKISNDNAMTGARERNSSRITYEQNRFRQYAGSLLKLTSAVQGFAGPRDLAIVARKSPGDDGRRYRRAPRR